MESSSNPFTSVHAGGWPEFHYLGDYRPFRDLGELPCLSGLCLGGWVRHRPFDAARASSRHWTLALKDGEAELHTEAGESEFLAHAANDGLQVWCTGLLFFGPRYAESSSINIFSMAYSVFSERTKPRVTLSAKVAQVIAESTLSSAVRNALLRPCHPPCIAGALGLAELETTLQAPTSRSLAPEVQRALLFVAHCEALTRSRISIFRGKDASVLGTSAWSYRGGGGAGSVQWLLAPQSLPSELLRGCLLVAPRADWLLSVLGALLALDGATPTLVVAERTVAPFVAAALAQAGLSEPARCLLALGDFSGAGFEEARVVLTSVEMLCLHGDADLQVQALKLRPWARLVTVGWTDVGEELSMCEIDFKYQTHLALALTENLHCDEVFLDVSAAAQLLGLSQAGMQDPLDVAAALQQRTLHLSPFSEAARAPSAQAPFTRDGEALRYAVVLAPQVDEAERAQLQVFRGSKRHMRLLFGPLCGSGKAAFAALPDGSSVLEHFSALGVIPTQFASALLQRIEAASASGTLQQTGVDCPVCFEANPPVVTKCGHHFCEACLQQSLATNRRCPACRIPLSGRDIVHSRAAPQQLGSYLGFLCELLLKRRPAAGGANRALLLASWGELHERVAALLRRQGGVRQLWAWRGSARQLCTTLQRFHSSDRGVLLIDPGCEAFPIEWARFEGVTDVYVLAPLESREAGETCCQLREIAAATREEGASGSAREVAFSLVTRDPTTRLPVMPSCVREQLPGHECPICIVSEGLRR